MDNVPVLVLNQNYEPLNVCSLRRAFVLVYRGKAEVVEDGRGYLRSPSFTFPIPSVIRLLYLIKRPPPQMRLTRREVFLRDNYTCQYCGQRTKELTVDHVIPRRLGGRHEWENVVAACKSCNHRKAGRSPQEARMRLIRPPFRPRVSTAYLLQPYLEGQASWHKFLDGWLEDSGRPLQFSHKAL